MTKKIKSISYDKDTSRVSVSFAETENGKARKRTIKQTSTLRFEALWGAAFNCFEAWLMPDTFFRYTRPQDIPQSLLSIKLKITVHTLTIAYEFESKSSLIHKMTFHHCYSGGENPFEPNMTTKERSKNVLKSLEALYNYCLNDFENENPCA
jgi:hypothetical protein